MTDDITDNDIGTYNPTDQTFQPKNQVSKHTNNSPML